MLEKIETELANENLEAAEERSLRKRAELIHGLLAPQPITKPAEIEREALGSDFAPPGSRRVGHSVSASSGRSADADTDGRLTMHR
jgi:hypothetical protein